ncbi:MAG: hypothetical protein ABA06_03835 [Parcubacteria bacterium C7867-001]|nr:MAG: hypothetical protein ABA06_03835 [Parcubacteria bacterium C7867-001]
MMRADELRQFLETQNLKPETVSAIEERLARVVITGGLLDGCFSDCDTERVLGDTALSEGFTEFYFKVNGITVPKDPSGA